MSQKNCRAHQHCDTIMCWKCLRLTFSSDLEEAMFDTGKSLSTIKKLILEKIQLIYKYSITLYYRIHSYPSQCCGQLYVMGSVASGVASSSSDGPSGFLPLGSTISGSAGIPPVPLNASIITPWKCHCLWLPSGWTSSTNLGSFR